MKLLVACAAFCLLTLHPLLYGTDAPRAEQRTVTVSPGDAGQQFEFLGLRDRDSVTITVVPASGWAIRSSQVSDPALLGWRKTADHVFKLIVSTPPTDTQWQRADFNGILVPVGRGGTVPPPEYPFSFNGRIKRVGADEGVASDFARSPAATLTSDIPAVTPADSGQATYTGNGTTLHDFRGSFMGQYTGVHYGAINADSGTGTPIHLNTAQGTSPGGTGATVWISKHGAPNGVGGKAVGERILLNTFADSVAATAAAAADARTIANQKAAESTAAAAAATTAATTATTARQAADAAQAAVEALVEQKVAEKRARATRLRAAATVATERAATARQAAVDAEATYRAVLARPDHTVKELRTVRAALEQAVGARDRAVEAARRAESAAKSAETELATAVATARTKPDVVAAQSRADALKQAATQAETDAETARLAAVAAATAAEQAEATARKREAEAALAVAIRDAWVQYRAETLAHENGHARILHDHVESLTAKLSTLQAIGWSPTQATATRLSREYWPTCRNNLISMIRNAEATAQEAYDAATNHGAN